MKTSIIHSLTENFETCAHETSEGVEFWMARDLQYLLGYTKWDNFQGVILKAKTEDCRDRSSLMPLVFVVAAPLPLSIHHSYLNHNLLLSSRLM